MSGSGYDTVIGLEIHVQLATRTKMFCADVAEYGAPPNTHVCPVCLGLPGSLPVPNGEAVRLAVRAAEALGCDVQRSSVFARKNYFYPDLPKGYQITQYDRPLATGGGLDVEAGRIRIRRVHLEEDTGKSLHDRVPGRTAIDLNRAGVPLIEIVTEPDLTSAADARSFLTALKRLLEYLEVSDCDMEKGSLRVDANVSVGNRGGVGTRVEIKNMNSFGNVERALRSEGERQVGVLSAGGVVEPETRWWDAAAGVGRPMRSKEESRDYRYFPEPDLPPLVLDDAVVATARAAIPELPARRARRFVEEYGLPAYDADVLTASRALADFYEAVARAGDDPKAASNWVMTDVLGWLNQRGATIESIPVGPDRLAELIRLVVDGTVSTSAARTVFATMAETGEEPRVVIEREGLARIGDADQLAAWVDDAVAEHPEEADRFRGGDERLLGFFMGQVMRRSGGAADPGAAAAAIRRRLTGGDGPSAGGEG